MPWSDYLAVKQIGDHLVSNIEGRVSWLELLKAVNESLPESLPQDDPAKKVPDNIWERNELHITNLECQRVDDLAKWFSVMKAKGLYTPLEGSGSAAAAAAAAPGTPAAPGAGRCQRCPRRAPAGPGAGTPGHPGAGKAGAPGAAGKAVPGAALADPGPKGPGWVIEIKGHHFHNKPRPNTVPKEVPAEGFLEAAEFVRNTLMHNLVTGKIAVPSAEGKGETTISMKDLGITYPCSSAGEPSTG